MFSLRPCRPTLPDQIEGLPEKFYPCPVSVVAPDDELPDRARRFLDALPARVHQRGDRAFYDRVADSITMPPVALFSTRAYFASTLAHEVCNIASVLISRTVDGLCALLFPNHRTACCAISGRES